MKRLITYISVAGIVAACATVPYTNRRQVNVFSPVQEAQLGADAYNDTLKKTPLSKNQKWQNQLKSVGQRIQAVSKRPDFEWEFNVLEGKMVNAFALPGGKVAFWEGIIPICQDETGIAVVMGHEVAHAIASHGAERMTQGMGLNLVGQILSVGLSKTDPATRQRSLQLFGLGAQVGAILPWGRKQESEADKIGLILMAKAGYDPREAPKFWKRMAALGGEKPPEFLSTHPSDKTRINNLQKWMPEALSYYKP